MKAPGGPPAVPMDVQRRDGPSCMFCGQPARPTVCPGDGAVHRHGGVHMPDGFTAPHAGQVWHYLCGSEACAQRARGAWADARELNQAARQVQPPRK